MPEFNDTAMRLASTLRQLDQTLGEIAPLLADNQGELEDWGKDFLNRYWDKVQSIRSKIDDDLWHLGNV